MSKVIGIDLGTGNSCVAVVQHGEVKVIPNSEGGRTTPSVFAITKQGDRIVGQLAKRQAITNPKNTIYSIKRLIGRSYKQVEGVKTPYTIKADGKGQACVSINDKDFTPQEISAQILKKMKETAEDYLGEKVTQAVITVPAYFGDDQRTATKDAGKIAGLEVLRIINEPTAAALSYGLEKGKDERVVVIDFGSGTFDVSVLDISDGVIQVLSTNGDTQLGGDDVDDLIIKWIVDEFCKSDGIDLSKDPMALQRVKQAAEKAKIDLSGQLSANINLPFITADATGPKHLNLDLSRANFENMISDILKRLLEPCKVAMTDAKLSNDDIDEVLLVGGSTRIPKIQEGVKKFFGKEPNKSLNPDEVVAMGAAVQGAILSGDESIGTDVLLLDVTPLSLGITTVGNVMTKIIEKNTTIPTKKSQIFSTAENNQNAVTIEVLQGERTMSTDNKCLGNFQLVGIPPAPRGIPQIEVTFDIDSNGIIHVSAVDKGTGKEQSIRIDRSGQLSDSEVEKMIKDAELHAAEDKNKQEIVEAKNSLDMTIFATQGSLKQFGDKLSDEDRKLLEVALSEAKSKRETLDNKEDLIKAKEELLEKAQKLGEAVYASGQQEQQEPQSEQAPKEGEPIDAEFKVMDD